MFALFYGLFEMIRPEAGRCCQEYHIRQGDGLFICVKTYKFMFFWNIHFFWMSLCDGGIAGVEAISESIGHCHQFNIMSCSQSLEHSTGTTSTTANNSNFYHIRSRSISARHREMAWKSASCQECTGFEKISSWVFIILVHHCVIID